MRILYSHRINSHDGQGVHVEEMVRALREAGHEVLVIGPSFYERAEFGGESRLVAIVRRFLPSILSEVVELAYNIPAYRRLLAAWRSFRPELIYERCNLYFLAGTWLARRHGAKLFLEVNAPLAEERAKHGGLRLPGIARKLERYTWCHATRILPVTQVLADILVQNGVDSVRVRVVPNGIDLARFPDRPVQNGSTSITLGFVGFVRPWHGLDTVIEGLAQSSQIIRLVIVGEGPAIPDLIALAAKLGVSDRVEFAGLVLPEAVPLIVSRFDIALQPSATAYASPLKIFDYMAASCAIVAPDQPNIREILTHAETAWLFDPVARGAMWQATENLIADSSLRVRLGKAARDALEVQDYTWAGNAARVARMAQE